MIRVLASSNHETRVRALKDNIRVVVAVHEGGHCLMGRLHKVEFPILLPAIRQNGTTLDISQNAGAVVKSRGLTHDSAIDILLGGYCGELAFYDEYILLAGKAEIWINTDRATNDFISLLKYLEIHPVALGELERQLNSGGVASKAVVQALFNEYGIGTYRKMRSHRDQLIAIAQELFDYWSARQFEECVWPATQR